MRPVRPARVPVVTAVVAAAALTAVTGCTEKSDAKGGGANSVSVTATDDKCEVSKKELTAGHVELAIENKGSKVTEVYLLFPDDRIVSERENIGPGTKQKLTAEVKAGSYDIACKPGMKGDGIRQKVTVTGGGKSVKRDPRLDKAVAEYRAYAQAQADETLPATKTFTDAVREGDLDAAKKAYAPHASAGSAPSRSRSPSATSTRRSTCARTASKRARTWRRTGRAGTVWSALWKDEKTGKREKALATQLDKDLLDWQKRVGKAVITPTSMANGAKELLDEVATGKVTGEEERYSHTDLVDFKANVEGAQKSYELLKPVAAENDPKLTKELDKQFAALNKLLEKHREGGAGSYTFTSYDKVGKADRKELHDGVNALAEPLSKLAAAVAVAKTK